MSGARARRGVHPPERPARPGAGRGGAGAAEHYDEESLAVLVVAINAWNNIAVTTRMRPGSYR
ncbi:hypothetical protein [Planotetraspora phitsanulokensis]|uniref:hypothetical protein n=1 Tax=Planotetraspora phitsanulokensis TaxID=575192 RepID=UPI001EF32B9B|nr:hypothetical protein [Planotetraspora phitsanulokensis]